MERWHGQAFSDGELAQLETLALAYGVAWRSVTREPSRLRGWVSSRKWTTVMACAALLAAPSACSDDTTGPGGESVPFESYCDEWVTMACEVAAGCDCLDGYSEALCRTYLISDCQDEVEEPVDTGHMAYDPEAAGRCICCREPTRFATPCSSRRRSGSSAAGPSR